MTDHRRPRWATFDCFGTLVDWRHGTANGLDLVFPGRGADLLAPFKAHEVDVQAESPASRYRDVLAEAFRRTAHGAGLPLREVDAGVLGETLPYWPVFDDVAAALTELRDAGWSLALLTNCDQDLIGHTQRRIGAPIDAVVSAEMVGSYKPDHNHFTRFATSFGAGPGNWVHVAQSWFHDMVPAREFDARLPRVWIDRLGESTSPDDADVVLPGLTGLADAVHRAHRRAGT